jgi:hypothetical protein
MKLTKRKAAEVSGAVLGSVTQSVFSFVVSKAGLSKSINEVQKLERNSRFAAAAVVMLGLSSVGALQVFKVRSPLVLVAGCGGALVACELGSGSKKGLKNARKLHGAKKEIELKTQLREIVAGGFSELAPMDDGGIDGKLVAVLASHKVAARVNGSIRAPRFDRYKLQLAEGVKFEAVTALTKTIQLRLGSGSEPIVTAQKGFLAIDIERSDPDWALIDEHLVKGFVPAGTVVDYPVGIDIERKLIKIRPSDSATCHLLIAGITGSGKSVWLKSLLRWLMQWRPDELQIALIDPKGEDFTKFEAVEGRVSPYSPWFEWGIIHDAKAAVSHYKDLVDEMLNRYALIRQYQLEHPDREHGFAGYNKYLRETGRPVLPQIVSICDEYAQLTSAAWAKKLVEEYLQQLLQMARAAGISIIVCTQRPSMKLISPELRENFPCRIGLKVSNAAGSSIILGGGGGDASDGTEICASLLGNGDLILSRGKGFERLQSLFWDGKNMPPKPTVSDVLAGVQIPAAEIERGAEAVAAIASGKSAPVRPAVRTSSVQVTSVQSSPVDGDVWSEEVQEVKPASDPGLELYREYREWRESGKAPYLFYEKKLGRCSADRKAEADRLMMPHFLTWIRELNSSGKTAEDIVFMVWNLTPTNNPGGQKFEAAMRVVDQVLAVGAKA